MKRKKKIDEKGSRRYVKNERQTGVDERGTKITLSKKVPRVPPVNLALPLHFRGIYDYFHSAYVRGKFRASRLHAREKRGAPAATRASFRSPEHSRLRSSGTRTLAKGF